MGRRVDRAGERRYTCRSEEIEWNCELVNWRHSPLKGRGQVFEGKKC
jgi:hypothetical protein